MAKLKIQKEEVNIVWSDNPEELTKNKKTKKNNIEILPENYLLEMRREKNHRGGKTVSVIFGEFSDNPKYFKKLCQEIKKKCGSGGTFKGTSIEIQGDFIDDIKCFLSSKGFKVKVIGG